MKKILKNIMKSNSIFTPSFIVFVAGLLLFMVPISHNAFAVDTNKPNDKSLKGALTSIQNDEGGKPAWIVSGVFKIDNYSSNNKTTSPVLNAIFYMIKIDGNSSHTHTISDFKMTGTPITNGNSTTINGTSTIMMKGVPFKEVPTTIKVFDKSTINIWLDPSKVKNHFGNTPLYGTHHLICLEKPQYCT